ncbi:AAA family ATPase [Tunturiibacter gelidiferens]|uniref:AAA family ATPase n=1 Tax=Tunturiibacter gelidiferens TaxID=3069689 RepID=UPI003D9BADB0
MIESIEIHNTASYRRDDPQKLEALAFLNFVYGGNGSGKTTLSRLIDKPEEFPDCTINWKQNNRLETLVYNRDFVGKNFFQSSSIQGIFTLGAHKVDVLQSISALTVESEALATRISGLQRTRSGEDGTQGKEGELRALVSRFTDRCWKLKTKYDNQFQQAFAGVRADRIKFRERVLQEKVNNKAENHPLTVLETKAASVFDSNARLEGLIPLPDTKKLLEIEKAPILQRAVVGKTDVDIAQLIAKLSNSDWVRQGATFLQISDQLCPFCQQKTPESLTKSLEDYFDDSFDRERATIGRIASEYRLVADQAELHFRDLLNSTYRGLEGEQLQPMVDSFSAIAALNNAFLEGKRTEPSKRVELTSLAGVIEKIEDLVGLLNSSIQSHNNLVANLRRAKAELTSEIWRFLLGRVCTSSASLA